MNVVARADPFTLITVVGTKPVPVRVRTSDAVPANALVGDTDARVGAGLSTSRLVAVADPLLYDPFKTATGTCAPLTNCEAGTIAVSCVALPKVVASSALPTWTTLEFRNPEPEMVSVRALEPAGTLLGLMDAIAGVGVVLPTEPLEPEPPLEHPPIAPRTPSAKIKAE